MMYFGVASPLIDDIMALTMVSAVSAKARVIIQFEGDDNLLHPLISSTCLGLLWAKGLCRHGSYVSGVDKNESVNISS